jgi:anaerobic magnesium-protoporphyrin IX monomethyl ester cyclase
MKVCLIIPKSAFLQEEKVFPALGILRVGASLEQAGHEVVVVDNDGTVPSADVYGITATTPQMPEAMKYVGLGKTILGGPHPTLVAAAVRRGVKRAFPALDKLRRNFSVVVAGDGEEVIHVALKSHRALLDADSSSSLWWCGKDYIPARHLLDVNSYKYSIDGHWATSIISQLGCPFGCNFCGGRSSPMLRKSRVREPESVLKEIKDIHTRWGFTGFMFYDDELNVSVRLRDLLQGLVELQENLGVRMAFRGFVKAELFTEEQARLFKAAGFRWLLCGFESASPRILKNIDKKATRQDNTLMLRIARKHGIKVKALMSIGHPGESEATIADSVEWLRAEKPDDFDMTVITVYPGTPYYDKAEHHEGNLWRFRVNGDVLYHEDVDFTEEAQYYKGVPGEYKAYVSTDYLSATDIVKLRDAAEKELR